MSAGANEQRAGGREVVLDDVAVVTMDRHGTTAESVLLRDGRIAAVGSREETHARASAAADFIPLDGATVLPGLIDAHCHLTWIAFLKLGVDCSPENVAGIPELKERLREAARERPGRGWVYGSRYLEYRLREHRHPTRHDLDEAVGERPCVVFHRSVHACVLSSAALAELGLRDDTPDPPGGILGRDADGRLTGVLYEQPSFDVLEQRMAREMADLPVADRVALVQAAGESFGKLGITTCFDAALRGDWLDTLSATVDAGRLPVRLRGLLDHRDGDRLDRGALDPRLADRFRLSGVKIFADGGISSRTAAIDGTYMTEPFGSGVQFFGDEELAELIAAHHGLGRQIGVHAQGDRAIESVISAFERAMARSVGNPLRHRIEHTGMITDDQIGRMAELRLQIVSQPGFVAAFGDGFVEAFGPDRAERLFPFRSIRRAGVLLAGSSDAPITTPDPLAGIGDAMLRRTVTGRTLGEGERLAAEEALALYTTDAAFALGDEATIGSVEPGKAADLTIVDRDPLTVPPDQLAGGEVLSTLVAGQPIHDRTGALS